MRTASVFPFLRRRHQRRVPGPIRCIYRRASLKQSANRGWIVRVVQGRRAELAVTGLHIGAVREQPCDGDGLMG